ncbi:MAG: hypothetical protein JST54_10315 [Deltaproteobacteria bacterium]|nr:hypothetical protein [Deltaproteobacteria bacterium]
MALGSVTLGHWRGVPVRMHWTAPLGAWAFSGFRFAPGFWLGYLLLIVIHELGHAAVVLRAGGQPIEAVVSGVGGVCRWRGDVTRFERALIAWGGVGAQALVFCFAWAGLKVFGWPHSRGGYDLVNAFLWSNAVLIVVNLIPIPPLDGAEAWPIFAIMWRRGRALKPKPPPVVASTTVAVDGIEPVIDGTLPPELDQALNDLTARSRARAKSKP